MKPRARAPSAARPKAVATSSPVEAICCHEWWPHPGGLRDPHSHPRHPHIEPTSNQILTVTATFAPTVQTLGGTLGLDFNVTPGDDELVVQSASGISNIVGSLNLAASGEATTNRTRVLSGSNADLPDATTNTAPIGAALAAHLCLLVPGPRSGLVRRLSTSWSRPSRNHAAISSPGHRRAHRSRPARLPVAGRPKPPLNVPGAGDHGDHKPAADDRPLNRPAPGWMSRHGSCWTVRGSTLRAQAPRAGAHRRLTSSPHPVPSRRSARTV